MNGRPFTDRFVGVHIQLADTVRLFPRALALACLFVFFQTVSSGQASLGGSAHNTRFSPENLVADGFFSDYRTFGTLEDSTNSVASGDLDGDGNLDIVVGNYGEQNAIYLNDGSGNFSVAVDFGTGNDSTYSIALGDLDGDGDLDVVVGNDGGQNALYLNDGKGNLTNSRTFGPTNDATRDVALGDVNSDGYLDIVVGNLGEANVVYLNDGVGNFSPGPGFGTGDDDTHSVALSDLDGDGDLDIVVGNSGQNFIFLNNGADFSNSRNFGTGGDNSYSIVLGDVNSDNHLDIVVGNYNQPNAVYLNDGVGNFSLDHTFAITDDTYSLALGDVDGDGDLDVVVGNSSVLNVFYLNDGDGTFTGSYTFGLDSQDPTRSVALGDMDGDGDLDIIIGNNGWIPNAIAMNDGAEFFADNRDLDPIENWITSLALGDLDSDGDLDIVVGDRRDGLKKVYLNSGAGEFNNASTFGFSLHDNTSIALGDVNDDGHLDVVVGNRALPNALFLNNGLGNFSPGHVFVNTDDTSSLALGDVDGDRDLDLLAVSASDQNALYLNNGAGQYNIRRSLDFGGGNVSVALGDVDNDGDLDIVLGKENLSNWVYLNDGLGYFTALSDFGIGADSTASVALGDMDGDGNLDVVTGNYYRQDAVYLNDGGGKFTTRHNFGSGASDTLGVAVGDLDGDGDLDIVTSNNGPNIAYLNDGEGNFSTSRAIPTGRDEPTPSLALGDLNGDGDLDIVTGSDTLDYSVVYLNGLRLNMGLPNNLLYVDISRPITTDDANFFSTQEILEDRYIQVPFLLFDPEEDPVGKPEVFYSLNGGGNWLTAKEKIEGALAEVLATGYSYADTDDKDGPEFEWIEIQGSGTPVTLKDDFYAGPFDIGFEFPFYGQTFTKFWVHSNGGLTFTDPGDDLDWDNRCLPASDRPFPIVAPFWDDLNPGAGGGVYYQQVDLGKTVVEFYQVPRIGDDGPYTFQVILRADGGITFQYLDMEPPLDSATIGIQADGGRAQQIACNTTYAQDLLGGLFTRGTRHIFTWDTFESGFFGQSDNVVLRFVAYSQLPSSGSPGTHQYPNRVPGPFQWPSVSDTTFPIRVRGTQVRVMYGDQPVEGAIVYHTPYGQEYGTLVANSAGYPYHTDSQGYLQGRGEILPSDTLVALAPISSTANYDLYHTNAKPTVTGLTAHTIASPGVQTLTVNESYPLLLFNLDISLEWDARNDGDFLSNLEGAIQNASAVLYDVSDGQIGIGEVRLHQNRENWSGADVVIYAQSGIRPRATMGGVVDDLKDDVDKNGLTISNAYGPGQVRLGPNWDPFGSNLGELTQDWQRALAHELSHYLLFLPDNYLGIGANGQPIHTDCRGSFMTNTYDDDYSEFLTEKGWTGDCLKTVAQHTTGRTDWSTIQNFYNALFSPSTPNPGPSTLPLILTHLVQMDPATDTQTFEPRYFDLRDADSGALLAAPRAQGFLFKTQDTPNLTDDQVISLGATVGGGDRIKVRGAEEGDRLCIFGPADPASGEAYLGCRELLDPLNASIPVEPVSDWNPNIIVHSVTSTTMQISVTLSAAVSGLNVQVFPAYGEPGTPVSATWAYMQPLDPSNPLTFIHTIDLEAPAFEAWVRVWVPNADPIQEALSQVFLSPPWGPASRGGGASGDQRAWGANRRLLGAPAASGDGQVTVFNLENIFADTGMISLQAINNPPGLPSWLRPVGQSYRFAADQAFPRVIAFNYLQREVPPGHEHNLSMYFSPDEGHTWERLTTDLEPDYNQATASMPTTNEGQGLYALVATIPMPALSAGWNLFSYPVPGTRAVGLALASIQGSYTSVYEPVGGDWRLYDATVTAEHPEFVPLVIDLEQLEFGHSYWLYATEPITPYLGVPAARAPLENNSGQLPATYYGWVGATADFTPTVGLTLTAWIDDHPCGQGTVTELSGQMAYKVQVAADTGNGCGLEGRWVTFTLADKDVRFSPTPWDNRQAWFHSLGLLKDRLYLPIIPR